MRDSTAGDVLQELLILVEVFEWRGHLTYYLASLPRVGRALHLHFSAGDVIRQSKIPGWRCKRVLERYFARLWSWGALTSKPTAAVDVTP
jgi:hypothetical protein